MATRPSICSVSLQVEKMKSRDGRYRLFNYNINLIIILTTNTYNIHVIQHVRIPQKTMPLFIQANVCFHLCPKYKPIISQQYSCVVWIQWQCTVNAIGQWSLSTMCYIWLWEIKCNPVDKPKAIFLISLSTTRLWKFT